MKTNDVIYFSVRNNILGEDYPITLNFINWLAYNNQYFLNDEWTRENKLCVYAGSIGTSLNYNISAPKSWVEKNCPELFTDDEYSYYGEVYIKNIGKTITRVFRKKFSDFLDHPNVHGDVIDHKIGWAYPEYNEENFGTRWYNKGKAYCE